MKASSCTIYLAAVHWAVHLTIFELVCSQKFVLPPFCLIDSIIEIRVLIDSVHFWNEKHIKVQLEFMNHVVFFISQSVRWSLIVANEKPNKKEWLLWQTIFFLFSKLFLCIKIWKKNKNVLCDYNLTLILT